MENKKLVTKSTCKNDRRLVDLSITKDGLTILRAAEKKKDSMSQIMKNLTLTEVKALSSLLDKIRN